MWCCAGVAEFGSTIGANNATATSDGREFVERPPALAMDFRGVTAHLPAQGREMVRALACHQTGHVQIRLADQLHAG